MHDSLERILPWTLDPTRPVDAAVLNSHLKRYSLASRHVRGLRAADLACGVGYGSRALLDEGGAASVVGVDIDADAVALAREHYQTAGLSFVCAPYQAFHPQSPFDVIVSLETIEHLPSPEDFLQRCRKLLVPRGLLIGSVPITPSVDFNPHHLHDFTRSSICRLIKRSGFSIIEEHVLLERVPLSTAVGVLAAKNGRAGHRRVRSNIVGFYLHHPRHLVRRVLATLRFGLDVHYLVFVARALT